MDSTCPPNHPDASAFGLDWPWSRLADAMVRFASARQQLLAAETANDRDAVLLAKLDLDAAVTDYDLCREKIAALWLMGCRIALEKQPEAVAGLVSGLVTHIPVQPVVSKSIEDLEAEVERTGRILLKICGGQ